MGMETGLPTKLPFLARVNLSLTDSGMPLPSLPILPLRQGGDESGVDLMASQTNIQFFTIKAFARLWCHPRCHQSNLLERLPSSGRWGKQSSPERLCTTLGVFLNTKPVNHKGPNIKSDVPPKHHHTNIGDSRRDGEGLASEAKVTLSSSYEGQSFQFIPTVSTERISKEMGQKPLESLLWSSKS